MTILSLDALHFDSLPSPKALKDDLPATSQQLAFVQSTRHQVENILNGKDSRLLLVVGPCSIHDNAAALEYAQKLKELPEDVSKHFLVIMRAYFEKPRTSLGWKGMLYDPHLDNSNDLSTGLIHSRKLLLDLANQQIPAATEFLDPVAPRYFGDLISWACIGARTAESQIHRQFASGLNMPIAFKNNTSGNIDVAIKGIQSASYPHAFFGINDDGHVAVLRTKGNLMAHIVLRGGEDRPNYDERSIAYTMQQLESANLPSRVVIDCSHDNSCRNFAQQPVVFKSVIQQYAQGNTSIRGLALESHLFAGNQKISKPSSLQYAVSITDPCLDWNTTKELILWGANCLNGNATVSASKDMCAK